MQQPEISIHPLIGRLLFLKPKTENQNIKKIKRVAPKKGW